MELIIRDGLMAFPFYWQVPAATERAAYESIAVAPQPLTFEYIGFPWATIIDGLRGDASMTSTILMALKLASEHSANQNRRVTVAQHIHAMQFIELFKVCGVTDVFWSHATHQQYEIEGVRLHPFPLFPAQASDATRDGDLNRSRRYLANFIGAYNPRIYLSNVRERLFNDPNELGDLLIVRRETWHFQRVVYEEQINGQMASEECLMTEQRNTDEYLNAIKDSWFTLCPTGSGPSSIRIYESLCLGSIPIVLTKDLRLPGPQALWDESAIIDDDSEEGYRRALKVARSLTLEQRVAKINSGSKLFDFVAPFGYARLIRDSIAEK